MLRWIYWLTEAYLWSVLEHKPIYIFKDKKVTVPQLFAELDKAELVL